MTGRYAAPAAIALAMLLAGCAGSHVGDAWQCPLAQGKVCASVEAADPAVPETPATDTLARTRPLYETVPRSEAVSREEAAPDCARGCNPFAWLAELCVAEDNAGNRDENGAAIEQAAPTLSAEPAAGPQSCDAVHEAAAPASDDAPVVETGTDDLRLPETVGRVWIGPFVDADGVYREAAYVRVVLAPAVWRLP